MMSDDNKAVMWLVEVGLASFFSAAVVTFALLVWLRPLLHHYTLAKPNTRSSHTQPTPQGGGIAVIVATTVMTGLASPILSVQPNSLFALYAVFASAILLAVIGIADDIRPLHPTPRLILQFIAVCIVLAALPIEMRLLPIIPWWIERLMLLVALLWFVNLTNFMDGIDWMTVAEVVPVTAGLAIFGLMGALPKNATLLSIILCGAMIGFAPFNRPVARLFLGDVGSLPIGLLLGWLLLMLASNGHLAASLLLPLYYVADATITLLRRFATGEKITQAHRTHFYQRATDNGLSVFQIVGRVFVLNIGLTSLSATIVLTQSLTAHVVAIAVGGALVALLLWDFARTHSNKA